MRLPKHPKHSRDQAEPVKFHTHDGLCIKYFCRPCMASTHCDMRLGLALKQSMPYQFTKPKMFPKLKFCVMCHSGENIAFVSIVGDLILHEHFITYFRSIQFLWLAQFIVHKFQTKSSIREWFEYENPPFIEKTIISEKVYSQDPLQKEIACNFQTMHFIKKVTF